MSRKRKLPSGAKKKNLLQVKTNMSFHRAIQKLQTVWPEPRGFNVTEAAIKALDEVAVISLTKSDYDMNIGRLIFITRQLLEVYLGRDWVDKHGWGASEKPLGKFGELEDFKDAKYVDRLVTLAQTIYNLQGIEGIDHKTKLLKNEDVESALAELEGIELLFSANRKLKIIVPSGVKGADYDVEVHLPDGTPIACEMKCKFEVTEFSKNTIKNTITKGAAQLPKEKCGAIFIKLPEVWKANPSLDEQILDAIKEAFSQTRRVSVVVLHWESWERLDSGGAVKGLSYAIHTNPNARRPHIELFQIVAPVEQIYQRFTDIIKTPKVYFRAAITDAVYKP